jgi:hypothetical protein
MYILFRYEHLADAKDFFDLYINGLNEVEDIEALKAICTDYLKIISKINSLNITYSNPIYKKIDDTQDAIRGKILRIGHEEFSESENNIFNLDIYNLSNTIRWGKYKGKDINEVIIQDHQYILWCIANLDHFAIENVIFLFDRIRSDPSYIATLEINLIKTELFIDWDEYRDELESGDDGDYPGGSGWDDGFNSAFEGDRTAWDLYNND